MVDSCHDLGTWDPKHKGAMSFRLVSDTSMVQCLVLSLLGVGYAFSCCFS